MQVSDLLVPLAARWQRRVWDELVLVPRPGDAARQFVAGPDPDRVLVLGSGPAVGFGVLTQDLALPGHLARRLAAATRRGASVDVRARFGETAASAVRLVREARMQHYDAVVICIGATDAYTRTSSERWRADLSALIDTVRAATTPSTVIAVLSIRPLQGRAGAPGWSGLVDKHASRLDRIAEELCVRRPGVVHLGAPASSFEAPRTASGYDELAERITPMLATRLDLLALAPLPTAAREQRNLPDPELDRQRSLDRTGLMSSGSNARLDRLLRSARELFGITGAAITLVDGERVVFKAAVGMPSEDVPRRIAPCDRTIRRNGALVLGDLAGEPIAADGWRFYAGHPLESQDGYRIGALCLLDTVTHDPFSVDRYALAEVAARIETELWKEAAGTAEPDDLRQGVSQYTVASLSGPAAG
ncbi:GDSL-type esterase/lipase family protein [uncultured Amnibacterium sp.]|uniref:GDSL-type esterase/lipase family protein n=1 Tax=uncultured Amnibacterium sp. TaxID=1631851 RepID=UPI0035CB4914